MSPPKHSDPDPADRKRSSSSGSETNSSLGLAIVLALALLIGMAYMWQNFSEPDSLPVLVRFLGQLHPLIVHFPVALLLVVLLMETLAVFKRWRGLQQNTRFLLWLATLGAVSAVVLGYMLKAGGEYGGQTVDDHMWAGIGVAAGSLAALMLKSGSAGDILYRFVLTLTVLTLILATHLGSSIAHGRDYLTRWMPGDWAIKEYLERAGSWSALLGSARPQSPEAHPADAKDGEGAGLQATLQALAERGLVLRPVSAEDDALEFSAVNVADTFDDESLALFAPIAERLADLDLARTGITDASADVLGAMKNLTRLHLENTAITDATLAKMGDLDRLEYLNVYGTGVSDAGMDALKELESIRQVYAWQTGVTVEGKNRLEASVDGLSINLGAEAAKDAGD